MKKQIKKIFLKLCNVTKRRLRKCTKLKIFQWDEKYPTEDLILEDIKKGELYIEKENEEIMMVACINENQHPTYQNIKWSFEGRVLSIHRLAVNPNFQNRGLAKKMMQFLEQMCLKKNYSGIRLDTFVGNKIAIDFYVKLGYNQLKTVQFKNRTYFCFDKKVCKIK